MRFAIRLLRAMAGRWVDRAMDGAKLEAAATYVAGVKKTRQAFLGLLGALLLLLLTMSGFLLVHAALFAWLPWSLQTKALALFIAGAVYFCVGLAAILYVGSERTWMKSAKVDDLLARLPQLRRYRRMREIDAENRRRVKRAAAELRRGYA